MKARICGMLLAGLTGGLGPLSESSCVANERAAPVSAFELLPETAIELKGRGREPILRIGRLEAAATLRSLGRGGDSSDSGEARGSARVHLVDRTESSIRVRLKSFSRSEEGATARSEAKATLRLQLPPDLPGRSAILRIGAEDRDGLQVKVTRPDGTSIMPLAGRPGWYLIERADTESAEIRAVVTAESDTEGTSRDESDVTLSASIEAGPLMFTLLTQRFIRGGVSTSAYAQVGSILIDKMLHCTGTLVAPRTILTAAHCIEPWTHRVTAGRMTFAIGARAAAPTAVFRVVDFDYPRDPQAGFRYRPSNYENDLALLYLHPDDRPNLAPLPIHKGPPDWSTFEQEPLLFVGYGFNDPASVPPDSGVKREARWQIGRLEPRRFAWTNPSTSTCHFDSGGPAFKVGPSLLIVGVTSSGNGETCVEGSNTRLDAFEPWLAGRLR